jgi:hypothetical protein
MASTFEVIMAAYPSIGPAERDGWDRLPGHPRRAASDRLGALANTGTDEEI